MTHQSIYFSYIGEENESKCVVVQLKKGERYCFMG